MSKIAVIMYRCEGCPTTGEPEAKDPRFPHSSARINRGELLPSDWIAFKTISNMRDEKTYHFCPDCKTELSRLLSGMTLGSKETADLGVKPLIDIEDTKKED